MREHMFTHDPGVPTLKLNPGDQDQALSRSGALCHISTTGSLGANHTWRMIHLALNWLAAIASLSFGIPPNASFSMLIRLLQGVTQI